MKTLLIVGGAIGAAYLLTSSSSPAKAKDPAGAFVGAEASADGSAKVYPTIGDRVGDAFGSLWGFLSPGGLDGAAAVADKAGDAAKAAFKDVAIKVAILGGVALGGFLVYRKVTS